MLAAISAMAQDKKVENSENKTLNGVDSHYLDSIEAYYDSIQTNLKTVTVAAAKPLVKMEADKMAYDVESDVDSKSSTILDMLRKVPMVTVDGQDNITVNGSSSFKVYVDGKPNPMMSKNASQIFKMMPASAVSKIEVVTNPGAKYDAEGAVGILNLITSKGAGTATNMDGVTATIRGGGGNRGANGGVSLTAQEGKLSFSANAFLNYQYLKGIKINGKQSSNMELGVTDEGIRKSVVDIEQIYEGKQRTPFGMIDLNTSYDIDTLNTVSASFGYNMWKNRVDTDVFAMQSLMEYTYSDDKQPIFTDPLIHKTFSYPYIIWNRSSFQSYELSADWQHFFKGNKEHNIILSYMLSLSPEVEKLRQTYEPWGDNTNIFNENHPKSAEHTVQLDYNHPLGKGQTLSLGGKFIFRNNNSLAEYYDVIDGVDYINEDQTVDYRYKNSIAAAYSEYALDLGAFSAKAGLRYEHTWQDVKYKKGNGANFSKDYGNLVPSLTLSLRPAPTKNVGLTYNMRISRPGIYALNPYIDRSNPYQISYGNSYLDVVKNHNIGLTFSSLSQKLMYNIGLHQSICNNAIEQYTFNNDNLMNSTYGNILKNRNTSLNVFVNWLAFAKSRFMLNCNVNYTDMRSERLNQSANGWNASFMAGLQQTLPWELKLSVNGIHRTKTYSLQGYMGPFTVAVMSLTKSLLNDRLNITLQGVTGFNDGLKLKIVNHTEGPDFSSHQTIKVPIAQASLTVSYTIGNTKIQAKKHESRINNDFNDKKSGEGPVNSDIGTGAGM